MAAINYDKATGDGTLRIKDLNDGTDYVECWAQAGYTSFHWANLSFSTKVGANAAVNREVDFVTGAAWTLVARRLIRDTAVFTFKLLDTTNTQSMAGPTTHTVTIHRETVPDAPDQPILSNVNNIRVLVDINVNGNGGDPIDLIQIGYGTSSVSPQTIITTDGYDYVTGLTPGTTYYFWGQARNSVGYSSWSPRASIKTLAVPSAPTMPAVSNLTQTTAQLTFTPNSNGGSAITGYQVAYALVNSVTGAPTVATSTTSVTVTGLTPGATYYFWVRAQNAIGWSAWSASSSARNLAGVRIKYGNIWVSAVPYVNVGGVWKVAKPYAKQGGYWKEAL